MLFFENLIEIRTVFKALQIGFIFENITEQSGITAELHDMLTGSIVRGFKRGNTMIKIAEQSCIGKNFDIIFFSDFQKFFQCFHVFYTFPICLPRRHLQS